MFSNSSKLRSEKALLTIIYAAVFVVSFMVIIKVSQFDKLDYQNAMEISDSKWHREVTLDGETDDAQMILRWNITNTTIVIEAVAKTTGYVGIGFSNSRSMKGADIAFGWVKDGKAFLHDCHTTYNSAPLIDAQQDYYLVHGAENDTHTVLRFTRNLTTCDENDYKLELTKGSVKLIWVIGAEDPSDELGLIKQFHEPDSNNHGFRSVILYNRQRPPIKLGNDTHFMDLMADKVRLPDGASTFYWCQLFKLPEFKTKHQVIGFKALLEPNNKRVIHHIIFRECRGREFIDQFETYDGPMGFKCPPLDELVMDPLIGHCQAILIGYGAGNEGVVYPDDVGSPLGEEFGGPSYLLMEAHYNNAKRRSGIIDSSGLRLYYTSRPRKYDSSVMTVGTAVSSITVVPPGQKEFPIVGYCYDSCLQKDVPETGIRVMQVLLHAHVQAKRLVLRHFRNGVELPPIANDLHFDFFYQEATVLQNEITVLPNDTLSTECYYDTTNLKTTLLGGRKATEEMCVVIVAYYPKTKLSLCLSNYPKKEVIEIMGAKLAPDFITIIDEKNEEKTLENFLDTYKWKESTVKDYHHYVTHTDRTPLCLSDNVNVMSDMPTRKKRPPIIEYHEPDDHECERRTPLN